MVWWILAAVVAALLGAVVLWFRHVTRDIDAEY